MSPKEEELLFHKKLETHEIFFYSKLDTEKERDRLLSEIEYGIIRYRKTIERANSVSWRSEYREKFIRKLNRRMNNLIKLKEELIEKNFFQ